MAQQVPRNTGLPGTGEPASPIDCSMQISGIRRTRKKTSPSESCEERIAEAGER